MAAYTKTLSETISLTDGRGLTQSRIRIREVHPPSTDQRGCVWTGVKQLFWHHTVGDDNIHLLDCDVDDEANTIMIRQFSAPVALADTALAGLALIGKYLYLIEDTNDKIYKIDTQTGTEVNSFSSPSAVPSGITAGWWRGKKYLFVITDEAAGTNSKIYIVDSDTGTEIKNFSLGIQNLSGLVKWGKHFYVGRTTVCYGASQVNKMSLEGTNIRAINLQVCTQKGQIATDGYRLFAICDADDEIKIFKEEG